MGGQNIAASPGGGVGQPLQPQEPKGRSVLQQSALSAGWQQRARASGWQQSADLRARMIAAQACSWTQLLTRELARRADLVVTMGCGDECPYIPGQRYLDWDLVGPAGRSFEEVRTIRDDIDRRTHELVGQLDAGAA